MGEQRRLWTTRCFESLPSRFFFPILLGVSFGHGYVGSGLQNYIWGFWKNSKMKIEGYRLEVIWKSCESIFITNIEKF